MTTNLKQTIVWVASVAMLAMGVTTAQGQVLTPTRDRVVGGAQVGMPLLVQAVKLHLINKQHGAVCTGAVGTPLRVCVDSRTGLSVPVDYAADHVLYVPTTGALILGITKHPQVSGNGSPGATGQLWADTSRTGDCYGVTQTGFVGATSMQIADLDGTGIANKLLLYRQSDGRWAEYTLSLAIAPQCDTTDAY